MIYGQNPKYQPKGTMGVHAAKLLSIYYMEKVHRLEQKFVHCKFMAMEKVYP